MTSAQHNPAPLAAYLRPTAPIAAAALLPDDPGLALALAQATLDKPLMSNHHHGLWGYHGRDAGGRELTVQATGIGAPSAAAVLRELVGLGVTRVPSASGAAPRSTRASSPGDRVRAAGAVGGDGVSRALGAASAGAGPGPRRRAGGGDRRRRSRSRSRAMTCRRRRPMATRAPPGRRPGRRSPTSRPRRCWPSASGWGSQSAACLVVAEGPDGQAADEQLVGAALARARRRRGAGAGERRCGRRRALARLGAFGARAAAPRARRRARRADPRAPRACPRASAAAARGARRPIPRRG